MLIHKSPTLAAIKLTMLINIYSNDVAAKDTKRILVSRLCKAGAGHFILAEKRSGPQDKNSRLNGAAPNKTRF